MRVVIRVETITDWGESDTYELCQFERPSGELKPEAVGLSLADGSVKTLGVRLQQFALTGRGTRPLQRAFPLLGCCIRPNWGWSAHE